MLTPVQHSSRNFMLSPLQHRDWRQLKYSRNGFSINTMARKTAVSIYLTAIGRKGGRASSKARMEKLTPAQRIAVAKRAAARWAKPGHPSRSEAAVSATGR